MNGSTTCDENWPGRLMITNAKEAIKGLRWLLLHRRDNLEKDAARRLDRSLVLNKPLRCTYLLREELGELWEQKDGREAWGFLREWCAKAKASGIRQLEAMAQTPPSPAKVILPITRPGSPAERWKASTRESVACSPARSASATAISLNCASTLSMKLSSNSSAKTELSR